MIAAFGDLQVREVFRSELYTLRRYQVLERIVRFRQVIMDGAHDLVGGMRTRDGEDLGMCLPDDISFGAKTAGDNDLAVFGKRFADGIERFFDRSIDESACVDHDQIRILITRRDEVALGSQLRENSLRIHERLRAAQRNETHARLRGRFAARSGFKRAHAHAFTG